jgi:hypothetical protein
VKSDDLKGVNNKKDAIMTYRLFIDDERFPPRDGNEWVIARNSNEVFDIIEARGIPEFISFDHDLGENEPTGFHITKKIVEMDMDGVLAIPSTFAYYVHSANPVGKNNIIGYIDNYLNVRDTRK